MTAKLMDNNRRAHAAKVLAQASKKNQEHEETTAVNPEVETTEVEATNGFAALNEQYLVIREDILKLREDLAQGYDLLKDYIETKVNLRSLIRAK